MNVKPDKMRTVTRYIPSIRETILFKIGRNAKNNIEIIEESHPEDIWFHVGEESSCHVYIIWLLYYINILYNMVTILVLQIEDRKNDEFLNNNMQLNKIICQDNNMQYKFIYKSEEDVSPYWGKVFEIDKILTNPNNLTIDYIFWLDSDAFFLNFNKNISIWVKIKNTH
jgi:hypothetical protein